MDLTREQKNDLVDLLTRAIDSLHDSLCLEDIGDEAAYILSCRYTDFIKIRKIIEGKDNEKN